jgi:hypothetical protein
MRAREIAGHAAARDAPTMIVVLWVRAFMLWSPCPSLRGGERGLRLAYGGLAHGG